MIDRLEMASSGECGNNLEVKTKDESQLTSPKKLEACIVKDGQTNRKSMKRVRFAVDDRLEIEHKSKKTSECNSSSTSCNMEAVHDELIGKNQFRSKRIASDSRQPHILGCVSQSPKLHQCTIDWVERHEEPQHLVGVVPSSLGETSYDKGNFLEMQGNSNTSNMCVNPLWYHEGITKDESSLKRNSNVLGGVTPNVEDREESSSLNRTLDNEFEEKVVDLDLNSARDGSNTLKEGKTTSLTLDSTIKVKPTRVVRRYQSKHKKPKDDAIG